MKKFALLIGAALVSLGLYGVAVAADAPAAGATPPAAGEAAQQAHRFLERIAQDLNLTDEQKAKAKEIMQAAHAEAAKATDAKAKREIMQKALETIKTTVLTDAQRTKLQDLRKEHAAKAGEGGAAQQGHPLQRILEALGLTDDQKAKVKDILQTARAEAAKATDPKAKAEVLRKAFQTIKDTVLTDAQRTKLEELRKERAAKAGDGTTQKGGLGARLKARLNGSAGK